MGNINTHTQYFNTEGVEVPSVTTILKILNKPSLQLWANRLGMMHKDVTVELDIYAKMGTLTHKYIEEYINKSLRIFYHIGSEIEYRASISYENFLYYMSQYGEHINFIKSELKLTSKLFGGTIDSYGTFNNKYRLTDFKTSNDIHMSQFLQLAGYVMLLEENNYKVDEVAILALSRSKINTYKIKVKSREEMQPFIDTYKSLIDLYYKLQMII